ncbi:hypothetical protein ACLB1T_12970 [Escherichia coli]
MQFFGFDISLTGGCMSLIKVPCMQITNMHCSGQTVSLAAGDYHATIVTVGAGLAELTFQGCHLSHPAQTRRDAAGASG